MPQMDAAKRRLSLTIRIHLRLPAATLICLTNYDILSQRLNRKSSKPLPPTARQFYQEVQSREAIKLYCDWYYTTAERHRQELQQMRSELNILGWFRRGDVRESQLRQLGQNLYFSFTQVNLEFY